MKEFRSQLLVEELIVENSIGNNPTYLAAMNTISKPPMVNMAITHMIMVVIGPLIETGEEVDIIPGREDVFRGHLCL